MRTFDTDNIFKLYDGQLNKLFKLSHIKANERAYIYFKRPQPNYNRMHHKMQLINFILKHVCGLNLSYNCMCGTLDVAQLLIRQHKLMDIELDQLISAAFLNMMDVDIENMPSLKSKEITLRHKYKFEECEKPWEAE